MERKSTVEIIGVTIVAFITLFTLNTLQREAITLPGGTQISALFAVPLVVVPVILIGIGTLWFVDRKKQPSDDVWLQNDSIPLPEDASNLRANEPKRSHAHAQATRASKKAPSVQRKIILVLIIAALAIGSIAYLNNAKNYKINDYVVRQVRGNGVLTSTTTKKRSVKRVSNSGRIFLLLVA